MNGMEYHKWLHRTGQDPKQCVYAGCNPGALRGWRNIEIVKLPGWFMGCSTEFLKGVRDLEQFYGCTVTKAQIPKP